MHAFNNNNVDALKWTHFCRVLEGGAVEDGKMRVILVEAIGNLYSDITNKKGFSPYSYRPSPSLQRETR